MTTPTGPHETPRDPAAPANTPNTPYDPSHYGPYGQMLPGHPQYGQQPSYAAPAPDAVSASPGQPANLQKNGPAPHPSQFTPSPQYQPLPPGNPYGPPMPGVRQPMPAITAPQTVLFAVIAFVALLAVNAINVFLVFNSDGFDRAMRTSLLEQGTSRSEIDSAMNTFQGAMYVVIAAMVGVSLLFILKMRAGRNWARVVLTVVSAFGIVGLSNAGANTRMEFQGQTFDLEMSLALVITAAALSLAGLILLWLKPTSEYMNAKKVEKARKNLGY